MRERREVEAANAGNVFGDCLNTFRALDLLAYAYQQTKDVEFVRKARASLDFARVEIGSIPQARYGVPHAARRVFPLQRDWPDVSATERRRSQFYYPIPGTDHGQLFEMGIYMHKLHGLMVWPRRTIVRPGAPEGGVGRKRVR